MQFLAPWASIFECFPLFPWNLCAACQMFNVLLSMSAGLSSWQFALAPYGHPVLLWEILFEMCALRVVDFFCSSHAPEASYASCIWCIGMHSYCNQTMSSRHFCRISNLTLNIILLAHSLVFIVIKSLHLNQLSVKHSFDDVIIKKTTFFSWKLFLRGFSSKRIL